MLIHSDFPERLRKFVNEWKSTTDPSMQEKYIGDGPFHEFVLTEQGASWGDFLHWLDQLKGSWGFRGQREASWLLDTSLDRAVKKDFSFGNSSGYYHLDREIEGRELLFRFQQQAHLYISQPPPTDDLSSWFALMQHHGVPTRLLDWTKSSFVAMYFALEQEPHEDSWALWAIDLEWVETKGQELLSSKATTGALGGPMATPESINGLLRETEKQVIVKINPVRLDERMAAQQGFFLCKLFHQASFGQILMSMMIHPETPDRPVLRKLELKKDLRIKFLERLREMNIHAASLFPGLDGFGRSLGLDLEIKVKDD